MAEAGRFLAWWREQGSPGTEEFGITVTGEEQLVWLRDEQRVLQRIPPGGDVHIRPSTGQRA